MTWTFSSVFFLSIVREGENKGFGVCFRKGEYRIGPAGAPLADGSVSTRFVWDYFRSASVSVPYPLSYGPPGI